MFNNWGRERKTFPFRRLKASSCCFSKKFQRLVARRWLIAIINMVEMETIDFLQTKENKQGMEIYNLEGPIYKKKKKKIC